MSNENVIKVLKAVVGTYNTGIKTEMQKELKKDFKNIYMGFLIEDASPLGSLYLNNNHKMCCLDLLQTKEFLDIFEQSSKLDFALFSMTGNADNLCLLYTSDAADD